jgi:hypothetical protein
MSSEESCPVCVSRYNSSVNTRVVCDRCQWSCCRSCCRQYILSTTDVARCMNSECRTEWSSRVISTKLLPCFFHGEYKTHLAKIAYDRERSRLPLVQSSLDNQKSQNDIKNRIAELKTNIGIINSAEADYRLAQRALKTLYSEIANLEAKLGITSNTVYSKSCPASGCRGFLNIELQCGLCGIRSCKDCFEISGDEHKCNPDNLATAQRLRSEAKNCPSCDVFIYRISGCDHMFCTSCNTSFDWSTLRITGRRTNPHYNEYLLNRGRRGLVECRDTALSRDELFFLSSRYKSNRHFMDDVKHIIHVQTKQYERYREGRGQSLIDIGIRYLSGEITPDRYRTLIGTKSRQLEIDGEIADVLEIYTRAGSDIIRDFVKRATESSHPVDYLPSTERKQLDELRRYTNRALEDVCKLYKISTVAISYSGFSDTLYNRVKNAE